MPNSSVLNPAEIERSMPLAADAAHMRVAEMSAWQTQLLQKWRSLKIAPVLPPIWARGGHLQTLFGFLIPSLKIQAPSEEIFIILPDDDILHARLLSGNSEHVIYLFHGLGGSIESNYIQRTARVAQAHGMNVVMANHRGSGEGKELAKKPYHSGSSDDLSEFIFYGRNRWPHHRHITTGFSLSANASILLAAGHNAKALPDAAITVNAPLDLRRSSLSLTRGINRIYDINFMRDMRAFVKDRKLNERPIKIDPGATLYDFDEIYTAPATGFLNRADYYEHCSGQKFAQKILIPTFLIHAEDDPFIPGAIYHETQFSDRAIVHIEKTGGHLGYLTRQSMRVAHANANGGAYGMRWLDATLDQLLRAAIEV